MHFGFWWESWMKMAQCLPSLHIQPQIVRNVCGWNERNYGERLLWNKWWLFKLVCFIIIINVITYYSFRINHQSRFCWGQSNWNGNNRVFIFFFFLENNELPIELYHIENKKENVFISKQFKNIFSLFSKCFHLIITILHQTTMIEFGMFLFRKIKKKKLTEKKKLENVEKLLVRTESNPLKILALEKRNRWWTQSRLYINAIRSDWTNRQSINDDFDDENINTKFISDSA